MTTAVHAVCAAQEEQCVAAGHAFPVYLGSKTVVGIVLILRLMSTTVVDAAQAVR